MAAGMSGSGKTALLVQAVAQALASNWIVLYAPRGE
jgi:molybdopterin-guanine dinucleotide biosynthesis protein